MKKLILCGLTFALAALAALAAGRAHAQAELSFSGGLGVPLTLTLNAPVQYVVTTGSQNLAPSFDFQGTGNFAGASYYGLSGTIRFTINGGAAQTLTVLHSGAAAGALQTTDSYIYGSFPGVAVGDTVELLAGSLTTSDSIASAPPASGAYPTFLFDGTGTRLDAVNGMAVALEPSTWALLGIGVNGAGVAVVHRRRVVA